MGSCGRVLRRLLNQAAAFKSILPFLGRVFGHFSFSEGALELAPVPLTSLLLAPVLSFHVHVITLVIFYNRYRQSISGRRAVCFRRLRIKQILSYFVIDALARRLAEAAIFLAHD